VNGFLKLAARQLAERQAEKRALVDRFDWLLHARTKQRPPGEPGSDNPRADWHYWLVMAGRGFGKTRTGAETIREQVRQGRRRSIALVAPTLGDGRKLMIEGPSGILAISPDSERPRWRADKRELIWPNGAIGYLYSSEEPERLRGPEHDGGWCEEMGAWRNPEDTWSNLRLGLRRRGPKGDRPQLVITTTPRATSLMRRVVANPRTVITNGTTYENAANLDEDFVGMVRDEYEGTRLGEQELMGRLLTDTPGALWKMSRIEELRRAAITESIARVVIAIDPAVADAEERKLAAAEDRSVSETGIVVVARARCLCKGADEHHVFVLQDLSGYYAPDEWGQLAVRAYDEHNADRVVAEVNQGGALVQALIKTYGPHVAYRAVHASRGKHTRAEPVAALYEQGKVHHVGVHTRLEDQMTTWNPLLSRKSPDRMDALVWAITDLMLGPQGASYRRPAVNGQRRI
jgi:phage terminase large subunit-like protein